MARLLDTVFHLAQELEWELEDFLRRHPRADSGLVSMKEQEHLVDTIITTLLSITDMLSQVRTCRTPESGPMT